MLKDWSKKQGKEKLCYGFQMSGLFVLTGRQNESMCCTRRGDGEDVGFGVVFF